MAEVDIQRYLDGIESQHITKPKFMAHVEALLDKVDGATGVIKDMPLAFYVRNAVGAQLDTVGIIIGVDRRFPPVSIPGLPALLDDDTYRKVLLARIVQNQWDGTSEKFKEMWDATVGGELDATYRDNFDMSMDMHITGQTEPTMIEMILRGYIIPKPMGVRLNVTLSDEVVLNDSAMYAAAKFSMDAARVGVGNHIDTTTDTETTIYPGAAPTANAARIGAYNHIDTYTDAEAVIYPGAAFTADAARVGFLNHIDCDSEASDTVITGCCVPCNAARITIPNHIPDEQTDTDSMFYGATAYANTGHIAVAIN